MEIDKKCERCAFVNKGQSTCGFFKSKYYGVNSPYGTCEFFCEPTGKTIGDDIGDKGRGMVSAFGMLLQAMWGNNFSVDEFLSRDSALLDAYKKAYETDKKHGDDLP